MLTGTQPNEVEWTLPDPPALDDRLQADGSSPRELLEDIEIELATVMFKVALETGSVNPAAAEGWPSANRDVERTLAAQGCMSECLSNSFDSANVALADTRHVSLRRSAAANEELACVTSSEPHFTPPPLTDTPDISPVSVQYQTLQTHSLNLRMTASPSAIRHGFLTTSSACRSSQSHEVASNCT